MKNIDVIRNYIVENNEKFRENKIRKNSAITLIALVITIVVLLILAGVSLSVILGDNGILSKAKESKDKTEIAKYEEELGTCVLDLQVEEAENTFDMYVLRNKFVEKVKENENTDDIEIVSEEGNATIEGVYKGYEFTIDEKYVVHIGKKSTGIRAITELSPKGYTNQNVTATITIKCNNGISTIKQIIPTTEEISANGATEYVIRKENIEQNTKFEYEITDNQGNKTTKTIAITTIDKVPPKEFEIQATVANEGIKIEANINDVEATETNACSGIERIEYYVSESTENNYKLYKENPIKLDSGTYNIYVKAYDKAGNERTSNNTVQNLKLSKTYTNVTAKMVADNPEIYYGLKVTNFSSANGEDDWRIFYSDGDHIFLITGYYEDFSISNRLDSNTKLEMASFGNNIKYRVYWGGSAPEYQELDPTVLTLFKATGYSLNSSYENSKCVSTLLNTNNWKKYLDNEEGNFKAQYAIGSPTIEMWIESWNELCEKKYKNADYKIYWKINTGKPGYNIGKVEDAITDRITGMTSADGYKNKLYYPDTNNATDNTSGYWLSSPSASDNTSLIEVLRGGIIDRVRYNGWGTSSQDNYYLGLRPVVSLKYGETIDAIDPE